MFYTSENDIDNVFFIDNGKIYSYDIWSNRLYFTDAGTDLTLNSPFIYLDFPLETDPDDPNMVIATFANYVGICNNMISYPSSNGLYFNSIPNILLNGYNFTGSQQIGIFNQDTNLSIPFDSVKYVNSTENSTYLLSNDSIYILNLSSDSMGGAFILSARRILPDGSVIGIDSQPLDAGSRSYRFFQETVAPRFGVMTSGNNLYFIHTNVAASIPFAIAITPVFVQTQIINNDMILNPLLWPGSYIIDIRSILDPNDDWTYESLMNMYNNFCIDGTILYFSYNNIIYGYDLSQIDETVYTDNPFLDPRIDTDPVIPFIINEVIKPENCLKIDCSSLGLINDRNIDYWNTGVQDGFKQYKYWKIVDSVLYIQSGNIIYSYHL